MLSAVDVRRPALRYAASMSLGPDLQHDPRVFQANERTLLAWLRTGIGLMAFGFVVARAADLVALVAKSTPRSSVFGWVGVALVLLGATFSSLAAVEYVRVRRALLAGRPIRPGGVLPIVLAVLVGAAGVALAALLLWRELDGGT